MCTTWFIKYFRFLWLFIDNVDLFTSDGTVYMLIVLLVFWRSVPSLSSWLSGPCQYLCRFLFQWVLLSEVLANGK